jgi:dolichol-phosphate mannosyltransferase
MTEAGQGKLDAGLDYVSQTISTLSRGLVSPRLVIFGIVGASGVVVHMTVLGAVRGIGFSYAQGLAGLTAMTSNYFINNVTTYRDKRLAGWALAAGYLRFCGLCALGIAASIGVGTGLHAAGAPWPIAGLAGAVSGSLWNYVSTYFGVWRSTGAKPPTTARTIERPPERPLRPSEPPPELSPATTSPPPGV